jgi:hypothetical protein
VPSRRWKDRLFGVAAITTPPGFSQLLARRHEVEIVRHVLDHPDMSTVSYGSSGVKSSKRLSTMRTRASAEKSRRAWATWLGAASTHVHRGGLGEEGVRPHRVGVAELEDAPAPEVGNHLRDHHLLVAIVEFLGRRVVVALARRSDGRALLLARTKVSSHIR